MVAAVIGRRDKDGFWAYVGMAAWGLIVFAAVVLSLIF